MDEIRNFETWTIRKPAVDGRRGLVAAQNREAAEVGAQVLAEGGNAMDAAVAASFAIGALEPWMSGIGGGGCLLHREAASGRVTGFDFGMVSPRGTDPAAYPLTEGTGFDLFNWPSVKENRNVQGPLSIAVPGQVAGMALALERHGTRSWADSLAPAVALAERGMRLDWYATLLICTGAAALSRYEASRAVYLPDGLPPIAEWTGPTPLLHLGNLAATLRRLAEAGPADFYGGDLAGQLVADAAEAGCPLSAEDLAAYRAREVTPVARDYRGTEVFAMPGLTAGPSLQQAQALLAERWRPDGEAPDAGAYGAYAQALLDTYEDRLATMGDTDESKSPSCTTHMSVVDAEGNMVALTQTLLSLFGSRVVFPRTGVLMNNGIMWFDPRPDRPNSIAPGKKPLSNMCPAIARLPDGSHVALGASGGRRIFPAVFQLLSFLGDYGLDLDAAAHMPRIDVSGSDLVTLDGRIDPAQRAELDGRFNTQTMQAGVYPPPYACPNLVQQHPDGRQSGAAYIFSPWAGVAAA